MPTGLIVSKLVTTVILLLSNVITMFLPNFVQLDEARFYKDMDSLTIFENTLDEPIPQTEIFQLVEAHFRAPLADGKTVKKALIMGWDGSRCDGHLRILIPKTNEAACISCSTTAVKLTSAIAAACLIQRPTHRQRAQRLAGRSILTGEWADVHGITDNGIIKTLDTLDNPNALGAGRPSQ